MRLVLVEWDDSVALGETWVDNEVIRGLDVCLPICYFLLHSNLP